MIAFPNLNLYFNIDPIAFWIFDKPIYWYGLVISFAFILCYLLLQKNAPKYGLSKELVSDFVILVTPISIIGARLYYVAFNLDYFKQNVWEIFAIWNGGLAIYGAIIAAVITGCLFTKFKRINTWLFFDLFAPYLALGQSIGRWGNFINQEAYGRETDLPWKMQIIDTNTMAQINVHPTFLYESIYNLGLFLFLIWYSRKSTKNGNVFLVYLLFYGIARFFIEGLRVDSLMFFGIRISQILSLLVVLIVIVIYFFNTCRIKRNEK